MVLPPKIETSEELRYRHETLTQLKTIENGLKYDKLRINENLAVFFASNTGVSILQAQKRIEMFKNMELISVTPDGTLEPTKTLPYFMRYLRRIITLAEKDEKIMSPFSYYQRQFRGEAET